MRCVLLVLFAVVAVAPAAPAQVLAGTLVDALTRAPVADGVLTLLAEDSARVGEEVSDSSGTFAFAAPGAGVYHLRVERAGYLTATFRSLALAAAETHRVEVVLSRAGADPVVVAGTAEPRRLTDGARRFYERSGEGGFGTFITRDEIDRSRVFYVSELIARTPAVRIASVMGGNRLTVRGNCSPTVYVDGLRVDGYRSVDDVIAPSSLEGIEVYRSIHDVPTEFRGALAGCAAIFFWTRLE
jgi:hypothetical protein